MSQKKKIFYKTIYFKCGFVKKNTSSIYCHPNSWFKFHCCSGICYYSPQTTSTLVCPSGRRPEACVLGTVRHQLFVTSYLKAVRCCSKATLHSEALGWFYFPGTGSLDNRLCTACNSVAGRILQPPVLPHCHHAVHDQEKQMAAGQDVSVSGSDQEKP